MADIAVFGAKRPFASSSSAGPTPSGPLIMSAMVTRSTGSPRQSKPTASAPCSRAIGELMTGRR